MINRYLTTLTIFILAAMTLSACGTPATATVAPTATSPPPVTITIWHQWSGDYLTAIQAVFNQYMTEYPNVTIVLDAPQDMTSDLQSAILKGEGPDIIGWANDQIGEQALHGNIIDLGTLGVTLDFLNSTYEPAAVKGVIWQGKIWAVPESQEATAIVYNKAEVSEADFPSDPMDLAGLLAKAKAYSEAHPGKYLFCNQGLGSPDAYDEAPIYFGFGLPGFVDETGKVYVYTTPAVAAGNWVKEYSVFAPKEASYDICNDGIADGTYAAWWTGPKAIANLEKAGINYGILSMGKPFVGIKTLMISKNAVDRGTDKTALDIIKYYTNQANETQVALANRIVPANTAALNDPQIQAVATIKGFGASANLGVPMANMPYADAQWGPVGDATQAIWTGSQNPEQALAAAQVAIETAIAGMR
jgi:arabinogalactan oligomer/maltooligosaccharide transport system substrate-binding protein